MELTQQQETIIDEVVNGTGNILVRARAGTGKTATAKLAAGAYFQANPDHAIVGMAFNKSIAKDLNEAMPFATVRTANSFGHGAWFKRCGQKVYLNTRKNYDIIKELNRDDRFQDLPRAFSICKAWGMVPSTAPAEPIIFMAANAENIKSLFDNYNIDTEDCADPVGIIRECLHNNIMRGWKGEIDFDDQVYLSTIYKAPLPKADLLVLDETQDLNPIQRFMAQQMLKPGGRLLALGDDAQAIYGFRGADRDSVDNVVEEFNCKVLPLTVSFRCPKAVVLKAQEFVKDIQPYEHALEGQVSTVDKDYRLIKERPKSRMAILCRNNAPLVGGALRLIENNIGAVILGRDIERGLIKLIEKQKAQTLQELKSKLFNYITKEQDRLILKGAKNAAQLIEDKGKCLEILISNESKESNPSIQGVKLTIKSLFSDDDNGPITLSTIHKAKGLEWPVVFILEQNLMPSRFAKTAKELEQEMNLHYVAVTRAKETLIYIDSDNI